MRFKFWKPRNFIKIYANPEQIEAIEYMAKRKKLSVSEFMVQLVFPPFRRNRPHIEAVDVAFKALDIMEREL